MDGAPEDTICAVATPAGEGGIGVVRISGPGALVVAEKVVRLRSNQSLGAAPSHTLHLADILSPRISSGSTESVRYETRLTDQSIDEALVVFMKGPRSFTAEDVVEIHCHGSGVVLGRVCEACISAGARLAAPGEFTKRAFLNGRLDLSQAEAVLDTIKAKSQAGLKIAQRHLRGELGRQVDRMRARLLGLLAHVEAGIDFVDEDIAFIGREELITSLLETLDEIEKMLATAETGRVLREGARVVIVGRPNVGKSSLLNSLLREDRAIVTEIPGTTRDVIEESVIWDGLAITLVDTAGLRETTDVVEQEGIKRTRSAQENGDMVLHVLDAAELNLNGLGEFVRPADRRQDQDMVVINKCDLVDTMSQKRLAGWVEERTGCSVQPISVQTGAGLEELKEAMRSRLSQVSLESNEGVVITNVRHRLALERAGVSVREALDATRRGIEPEFVAVDLRGAGDALGEITGVITSDDILDRIFSEFCIGK
jgi:tRNA modification GTPase